VSIAGAALTLVSIASTAFIAAWIKARSLNLHYDNISAPGHFRVQSHVKPSALGVIYLKNTALLILTLGIAYPWNKVRTARYVAACIHVATSVSLDNFAATATRQLDATGDSSTARLRARSQRLRCRPESAIPGDSSPCLTVRVSSRKTTTASTR